MNNEYENEIFFEEYAKMARSREGLPAAGKWHQLKPLFPPLQGKAVLDLGCGYGWHCKYAAQQGGVFLFNIEHPVFTAGVGQDWIYNDEGKPQYWPVEGMCPNLLDAKEVEAAVQSIQERYGRIDILVNNAGVSESTPIYDYTAELFDRVLDLNVKALLYTILPAVKIMKAQGGGSIINTSSMVSRYGQPAGVAYPTSKFAVNGMTISLARELGKDNIRVNAVAPGVTRTDMVAALPEQTVKAICSQIPLGRPGEPEDVANAFVYLASDMAAYVTGEILSVDGSGRS